MTHQTDRGRVHLSQQEARFLVDLLDISGSIFSGAKTYGGEQAVVYSGLRAAGRMAQELRTRIAPLIGSRNPNG